MGILYKWSKGLSKFLDDELEGDLAIAAMSAAEEYQAIIDYNKRLKSVKDEQLKEALNEAIMDESHHYQNFMSIIKRITGGMNIEPTDIEKLAFQPVGQAQTSGESPDMSGGYTGSDPDAYRGGFSRREGKPTIPNSNRPKDPYEGKRGVNFQSYTTIEEIGEGEDAEGNPAVPKRV